MKREKYPGEFSKETVACLSGVAGLIENGQVGIRWSYYFSDFIDVIFARVTSKYDSVFCLFVFQGLRTFPFSFNLLSQGK